MNKRAYKFLWINLSFVCALSGQSPEYPFKCESGLVWRYLPGNNMTRESNLEKLPENLFITRKCLPVLFDTARQLLRQENNVEKACEYFTVVAGFPCGDKPELFQLECLSSRNLARKQLDYLMTSFENRCSSDHPVGFFRDQKFTLAFPKDNIRWVSDRKFSYSVSRIDQMNQKIKTGEVNWYLERNIYLPGKSLGSYIDVWQARLRAYPDFPGKDKWQASKGTAWLIYRNMLYRLTIISSDETGSISMGILATSPELAGEDIDMQVGTRRSSVFVRPVE